MILKRRDKQPFWGKIKNYIWPAMGWGRFGAYVKKRVVRLSDTPHNVAMGIAFGCACSFNPYVGTHIIQAAFLAYIFGANIPASALGTLLGNPSTFPFLWWLAIVTGQALSGVIGIDVADGLQQNMGIEALLLAAKNDVAGVLLPWTIGAYVVGSAVIPICYLLTYPLIKASKAARMQVIVARKAFMQRMHDRHKDQNDKK